ncbi:hypothetical protein [Mesobacterium pallidum]|uniref:hypothetical protein n=1 Tax=Mesobacterium pallidum TaxID=2872037 RepID=UPI001EE2A743|nr:hypothetical protein [Mesobacterium pallidum]
MKDAVFEIKPALLRGPVTYRVDATGVSAEKGGTPQWQLPFSQVEGLRIVELVIDGHRLARIDLALPGGRVQAISQTLDARVTAEDPARQGWTALTASLLDGVAQVRPETPVYLGETPRNRGIMFGIGALSLLFAGGMAIAAAGNGRLEEAGLPLAVMSLFGGWIAWHFHPWRPEITFPVRQLAPQPEA